MTFVDLERKSLLSIISAFMLLATAACGSAADSNYADPVEACEVLPVAAVADLLDGSFEEAGRDFREHGDSGFWMSSCTYYSEQSGLSVSMMIRPNREPGDGVAGFEAYAAELAETFGEDGALEVTDTIGRRAGWQDTIGQLTVFSDDYSLIVGVAGSGLDREAKREIASRIAATTLQAI